MKGGLKTCQGLRDSLEVNRVNVDTCIAHSISVNIPGKYQNLVATYSHNFFYTLQFERLW